MADSMCGPSNALQSFQKHSTVDRTLQQDRLTSRQSPSQGFRSSPGPNAGLVNQDFEAFQAGQLPLDHAIQPSGFQYFPPGMQQPGPAAWASDFQRLNISSPPPHFQQQPQAFTTPSQQRHDTGGWHQDFAHQQGQMGMQNMAQAPMTPSYSQYRHSPMSGMGMASQYSGGCVGQQARPSMTQQQSAEAFDDEAFARAFEEASKAEMDITQDSSQEQVTEMGQDIMISESAERFMEADEGVLDQELIGADTIPDHMSTDPKDRQEIDDPDALSRTAGQLLDKVQHNQSSKFQNSQFLELMRQFRDREATVQGDKVVGVNYDSEMGGEQEAIKKELAYLSRILKVLVLDPDHPFQRTPQNVRNLLHTLLKLHFTCSQASTINLTLIEEAGVLSVITPLLRTTRAENLPSMHALVMCIFLSNYYTLPDRPLDTSKFRANRRETVAINNAGARISSTVTDLESEIRGDEPLAEVKDYILSQMTGQGREDGSWKLLGYKVSRTPSGSDLEVHSKRLDDILGPHIRAVREICEKRGIFCRELSVDSFFELVDRFEKFGGESQEFVGLVREMEGEIEEMLRLWTRIDRDEKLSMQRQLMLLEMQGRLSVMRAKREGFRLSGE